MKYAVVTTFHEPGYKQYGQRMVQTFLDHWPEEVDLYVYAERCAVDEFAPNLIVLDLEHSSPELVRFKTTWHNVPKANGDISMDPSRSRREDAKKSFKWDAIRFAHKVYSIFHCAKSVDTDVLIWMYADTICHSPITVGDLDRLCPPAFNLCF